MFKEPTYPMNFFNVEVDVFDHHFHILLNAHYPIMAFASTVGLGEIDFIDEPLLAKDFSSNYRVLGREELNEPIIKGGKKETFIKSANELNEAELRQIEYRKPKSVGKVVFNYWD